MGELSSPISLLVGVKLEFVTLGANLATVLARIQAEAATSSRPKVNLADIAADLTISCDSRRMKLSSLNKDSKER